MKLFSNFDHTPTIVASSFTKNATSISRHKIIVTRDSRSNPYESLFFIPIGFFSFPANALCNFCKITRFFIYPLVGKKNPLNFSILYLPTLTDPPIEAIIFDNKKLLKFYHSKILRLTLILIVGAASKI